MDRGADLNQANKVGCTPLHMAAYYGKPEVVQLLIDRGADASARAVNGDTPVQFAAYRLNAMLDYRKKEECARILAQAGSDLTYQAELDTSRFYDIQNMKISMDIQEFARLDENDWKSENFFIVFVSIVSSN